METNDSLLNILKRVRADAEDIADIIGHGILSISNMSDDFEVSSATLDVLIKELFKAKDNLNKSFSSLKRKL